MSSPKYRDYFITINKSAECYEEIEQIIQTCNYKLYGLITHDKDYKVENDNLIPKETHKHLMIELKNPVSFDSMKNKFKGHTLKYQSIKKCISISYP